MRNAPSALLALIVALAASAGFALTLASRRADDTPAREFQQLVGGLGFGPALDLSTCEFSFDPRLCSHCSNDCGPIPAGMLFCPYHANALFDPPSLDGDDKQEP